MLVSTQIHNSDSARPVLTERAKDRDDNMLRICVLVVGWGAGKWRAAGPVQLGHTGCVIEW